MHWIMERFVPGLDRNERRMPGSADARAVRAALARVARRLWCRRALRWALRAAAGALVALVLVLLAHELGLIRDLRGPALLGTLTLALALAVVPALRPVNMTHAARVADTTCGLGERLTTAVEALGGRGPRERLVVRDAARSGARLDVARIPRAPVGREAWIVAAGIVAGVGLWLHPAPPATSFHDSRYLATPGAAPAVDARSASSRSSRTDAEGSPSALREALRVDPERPQPGDTAPRLLARSSPGSEQAVAASGPNSALAPEAGPGSPPSRPGAAADATTPGAGQTAEGMEEAGAAAGGDAHGRTVTGRPASAARGASSDAIEADSPGSWPDALEASGAAPEAAASARVGLARMAVPPALRQYVQRYFEALRRAPERETVPDAASGGARR